MEACGCHTALSVLPSYRPTQKSMTLTRAEKSVSAAVVTVAQPLDMKAFATAQARASTGRVWGEGIESHCY